MALTAATSPNSLPQSSTGRLDVSTEAFKNSIGAEPKYAEAHYWYGVCLFSKAKMISGGKGWPYLVRLRLSRRTLQLAPTGRFVVEARQRLALLQ